MGKIFKSEADIQQKIANGSANSILGTGGFSSVRLVYHKSNPTKFYAMKKLYKKNEIEVEYILKELELHRSLKHPNIIKFYDQLETSTHFYFFLEYAPHGDLFDYVRQNQVTESQLLNFFSQVVSAIAYMHQKDIMHRDLKPENILIGKNRQIKVCDFGWSARYDENDPRKTLCGTYEYMAMEVYCGEQQTKKTDVWSLGILLYELMHGRAPFRGVQMDQVMEEISRNEIQIRRNLNQDVKDLILSVLIVDPLKRPSAQEILDHKALKKYKQQNFENRKTIQNIQQKHIKTLHRKESSQETQKLAKKRKFVKSSEILNKREFSTKSSSPGRLILKKKKFQQKNLNNKNGILKFKPKQELYSEFRNVYNFKTMQKVRDNKIENELLSPSKTQNIFDKKKILKNSNTSSKKSKKSKNQIKKKLTPFANPEKYKKYFKKKKDNNKMNKSSRNFQKKKLQLSSDFKLPKKHKTKKSGIYLQKNSSFSNLKLSNKILNNSKYTEISQKQPNSQIYLNSKIQCQQEPEIHIYKNRNFLSKKNKKKETSLENNSNKKMTPLKQKKLSIKEFNEFNLTEAKKRSQIIQQKRSLSNKKLQLKSVSQNSQSKSFKYSLSNQKFFQKNVEEIKSIYAQIPQIEQIPEKKTLIKKRSFKQAQFLNEKKTIKSSLQNKISSRSFSQKLKLKQSLRHKESSINKQRSGSFRITIDDLKNYRSTQQKLSYKKLPQC